MDRRPGAHTLSRFRHLSRRGFLGTAVAAGTVASLGRLASAHDHDDSVTPNAVTATRNADLKRDIPGYGVVETSSLVAFDVDGDGILEIIGGTKRRNDQNGALDRKAGIFVMKPNGTIMQTFEARGGAAIQSSPAIGRLFGPQGDLYLVIGLAADVGDFRAQGGIQAFRFNPTSKQFEFALEFKVRDDLMGGAPDGIADPVFGTPCLADVDNDGVLEVFFGGWDRWIYLIKPTPQGFVKVWDYNNADSIWSSGAAADVNGDGFLELIIGADISKDPNAPPGPNNIEGGYLLCFDRTGKRLWRNYYQECIYSSPAIADIDGDGKLEVVVGTSDSFGWTIRGGNTATQQFLGNFVVCVNAATGQEKWRFTTNGHGWSSPALGNFLGKTNASTGLPTYQVVATSMRYENQASPNNPSEAYLIDSDGREVWRRKPKDYLGGNNFLKASPVVADINGDGKVEALIPVLWDIAVFDAAGNQIENLHSTYSIFGSPCVADADGDGKLEVYIANSSADSVGGKPQNDRAWVHGWKTNAPANAPRPWPMFRGNPARTGLLGGVNGAYRRSINLILGAGGGGSIRIAGASDVPTGFTYQVTNSFGPTGSGTPGPTINGTPNWIDLTPFGTNLGTTPGDIFRIDIDTADLKNPGTYTITIKLTPNNSAAILDPKTIELSVVVAKHQVFVSGSLK